jgi:hypothetical protein
MSDLHLDPAVYPEPLKWDPSRYLPDRAEHLKKPNGWLGWGSGRHPCGEYIFQNLLLLNYNANKNAVGMKFAKLSAIVVVNM